MKRHGGSLNHPKGERGMVTKRTCHVPPSAYTKTAFWDYSGPTLVSVSCLASSQSPTAKEGGKTKHNAATLRPGADLEVASPSVPGSRYCAALSRPTRPLQIIRQQGRITMEMCANTTDTSARQPVVVPAARFHKRFQATRSLEG